ncbi:MAG: hypothetical protein ACFE91_04910 [Promethearchaeota archaeon]
MSGYYPATYGFEDVVNGQDHPEWNDISTENGKIVSEIDGHKKVYEAIDNSGFGALDILNFYEIQPYGTVEFWCRFSDYTEGHFYHLRREGAYGGPFLQIQNKFQYGDDLGTFDIIGAPTPQNNIWYHIRIDFRGSYTSQYQGLINQYTYFILINGVKYGPFNYSIDTDIGTFHVHTKLVGSGFTIWWDGVGYSWDPNYNIGDNLKEGLLISYINSTGLDWVGYSLNGKLNKTILGNTTIPMPKDGVHTIQVFGNDSIGTNFESDIRYFTIITGPPEITINSPTYNDIFGSTAPDYDLSINTPCDTIWYTIDEGITNITANGLTGTIDQTEWNKKANGIVTITFYANNTLSYIGSAAVQVVKSISERDGGQQIPGYNLFILISIIGIISIIIFKKRILK